MDLNGLLEMTVTGMGYELVGVERPAKEGSCVFTSTSRTESALMIARR